MAWDVAISRLGHICLFVRVSRLHILQLWSVCHSDDTSAALLSLWPLSLMHYLLCWRCTLALAGAGMYAGLLTRVPRCIWVVPEASIPASCIIVQIYIPEIC